MSEKRKIEVFSAGCPVCEEAVKMITKASCASCEVIVLDMNRPEVADRARRLGIQCVPAVMIDGTLSECCTGQGPDLSTLQSSGLGKPKL